MHVEVENLSEISIFPHYRGVPMDVEAVAGKGVGRYTTGQFLGQTYYTLSLDYADVAQDLHVGVTYSCSALNEDGAAIKTHWLYCTSVEPFLTFGVVKHWANPDIFVPALPDLATPYIELEELSDLVAIFPSHAPAGSLAQAQIGLRGWLVMMRLHSPFTMGFLIENPTLPTAFCEGAQDILISARSVRTMQSISMDALHCVKIKDTALFLRREH